MKKFFLDDFKYLLLAIFPILNIYDGINPFNLGTILLILVVLLEITIKKNFQINLKIGVTMFLLIMINIYTGIISNINIERTINNTIGGMISFGVLGTFLLNVDKKSKLKIFQYIKIVSLISTVYIFLQFLFFKMNGVILKGNIVFLNYSEEGYFKSIEWGRPTSFFVEPAHYVIYTAPIYLILIVNKKFFLASILGLGLIISTSSTGIFLAIILPGVLFLKKNLKNKIKFIILIVASVYLFYLIDSHLFFKTFKKFQFNMLKDNIRISGGVEIFKYLDFSKLLFGIGLNQLSDFAKQKGVLISNYSNTFLYTVISFGITGILIWNIYLYNLYRNLSKKYKLIFLILIFIQLSDQIIFNQNLFYLLLIISICSKISKGESKRSERKFNNNKCQYDFKFRECNFN
ncbi:hypothetical protein [uncultured Cetobacterium sp.]|uniref:hypothetical protein n=1 Tax=uncultured Cetobacterium sp. TaxID=527638 RepID=UPI002621AB01|nr:hypothetical protein [uncultured Cetobacterium sp.]